MDVDPPVFADASPPAVDSAARVGPAVHAPVPHVADDGMFDIHLPLGCTLLLLLPCIVVVVLFGLVHIPSPLRWVLLLLANLLANAYWWGRLSAADDARGV